MTGKAPELLPMDKDPADYKVVILGTPVWAGHMSSPMRSYIERNKNHFNEIATFSTMAGNGGDKVLGEIASLCGKSPIGQLVLTDNDIVCGRSRNAVLKFAQDGAPPAIH